MHIRRLILPVFLGLAVASPTRSAVAQHAGTVELGGFLQLDRMDEALQTKRLGGGAGGRFGLFFSPRWELEGDASYSQVDALANRGGNPKVAKGDKVQINYYVGRLNYNIPWGNSSGNAIILSGGVGSDRVDQHTDLVLSPDIGLRAMLGGAVALRLDVLSMIVENPASGTFKFPTFIGTNKDAAYLANYQARAGLSILLNNSRPMMMAPAVIREAVVATNRVNQDSIDAANRARMRQDSIDAANRRMQDSVAAARAAAERALADARAQLNAPIYFDYDKSEVRADAKSTLDSKLALLRANPSMRIRIEGNTDARGSNEYNMALGLRRANAARRYLVAQGIDNARFDVVSYGEERPVDQGTTDDAYAKNRRDDFVITVGSDNISVPK